MGRNLFLLIFLCEFSLCEEFIFWAKVNSQNNFIDSEILSVSKAMISQSNKAEFVCNINGDFMAHENHLQFLQRHKNELFECFVGAEISLKNTTNLSTTYIYSNTQLTIHPIRFDAKFNENFVIISKFNKDI